VNATSTKKIINELLVEVFHQILSIQQEHLRDQGVTLSMTEVHVLEAISKQAEPTMSKVALKLRVTVGTLTTSVSRLVEKGYVKRQSKPGDKRKVYLNLTKDAHDVLKIHDAFHDEMIDAAIEDLKLEESPELVETFRNLTEYFKNKY